LLLYSTLIADLITKYCASEEDDIEVLIMGDVTYGACCIDDLGARALGADFMVHYAHSCLVPINEMAIKDILYVFVTIGINLEHFVNTIVHNLSDHKSSDIYLLGTIQFTNSLFMCKKKLLEEGFESIIIPQTKPRSSGEVLGCTAPIIPESESKEMIAIFLADGRFHIESTMIQNDHIDHFYQYDPYSRNFTVEKYDTEKMHKIRYEEIERAKSAKTLGIILGTLGRQGNTGLLENFRSICKEQGIKSFILLLSEITPQKLAKFKSVDAWVQISCPRLSVDWGLQYDKPLLNTYEGYVLLDQIKWQSTYPMDFYSDRAGEWGVYYKINKMREEKKAMRKKKKVKIGYEN